MKLKGLILCLSFIALASCSKTNKGKHLFILSGQSNMVGLKPDESFTPILERKLGKENVIIVKDAKGAQPIRSWYTTNMDKNKIQSTPYLYNTLMAKIDASFKHDEIATVTFIWMQGERDAREELGEIYESNLRGLYKKLSTDLDRDNINFIIGRLSDFDLKNEKYPHWTMIRDIQIKVATSNPRFDWINTDDLNDGINRQGKEIKNDLHMSAEGYKILGERFAEKAIQLIKNNN